MSAFLTALIVLGFIGCSAPPAPSPPNEDPVAKAGDDQVIQLGDTVILNGSTSFDLDEEDQLVYAWTASDENPARVLFNPQSSIISFAPTLPGTYIFTLVITDGKDFSAPDTVTIIVAGDDNTPPVANAGPPIDGSRIFTDIVGLDGAASFDADGDHITFMWTVTNQDTAVTIDVETAKVTFFVAPVSGLYVVTLTVSDGQASANEVVTISVELPDDHPPIANAGPDAEASVGSEITLDGSGSIDREGAALTYLWTVSGPVTVDLLDAETAQPRFTPSVEGVYVFRLAVSDGTKQSEFTSASQVTITVVAQQFPELDGMIEIAGGIFTMGSNDGLLGEAPEHEIELSTYWIDKLEVTTADYLQCSDSESCSAAATSSSLCNAAGGPSDHPINCVTWDQAASYCLAQNKRLPTEAEWEKAARGTDKRRFPWGDEEPTALRLNLTEATAPVGSTPDGASVYGVQDMSGNVLEWTADWFEIDYYNQRPTTIDPPGPPTSAQNLRTIRSSPYGNKIFDSKALTTTVRSGRAPAQFDPTIGFRCARDGDG
jgi:sulfatase modifying factor 1